MDFYQMGQYILLKKIVEEAEKVIKKTGV